MVVSLLVFSKNKWFREVLCNIAFFSPPALERLAKFFPPLLSASYTPKLRTTNKKMKPSGLESDQLLPLRSSRSRNLKEAFKLVGFVDSHLKKTRYTLELQHPPSHRSRKGTKNLNHPKSKTNTIKHQCKLFAKHCVSRTSSLSVTLCQLRKTRVGKKKHLRHVLLKGWASQRSRNPLAFCFGLNGINHDKSH